MLPNLDELCSGHFRYADLCHCGETWNTYKPKNQPLQIQTYQDLAALANLILEPIYTEFGTPVLTYGFAGPELLKFIRRNPAPRIAPHLDQHAASELNLKKELICKRQGAAVDLYVPGLNSVAVAYWIATHLPFDRLYVYGRDKPIHLSYHKEPNHSIVWMRLLENDRSRIPQRVNAQKLRELAAEV